MNDPRPALERMAEILNVPIEAFWGFSRSSPGDFERLQECVELIHRFQQLQDREARERCLAFVQTEVERITEPPV